MVTLLAERDHGLFISHPHLNRMAARADRRVPIAESADSEEPWREIRREARSRPLQARVGDHAIFFRKAAVEITFEEKRYLVVPHGAILVLIRDDLPV